MKNFKKVISTVIALAISASSLVAVSASKFSDVADTASYAEAIEVLSALGIVNGYVEDGVTSFKPEGEITRAEAATMIVGALNMTEDAKNAAGTSQFADVNEKASWAAGYVNVGVSEGFIAGRSATEFDPQANVTYAEMCVMLTKITGYADYAESNKKEGEPWYACYTNMAAQMGLNKGASVPLTSALTRGTVAQMIYNAITTPVLGVKEYAFEGNTYEPQDGADNFKTILSDKFDGYVLTVKVEATAKSDSTMENDEANFEVVKADYWNDEVDADTKGMDIANAKLVGVDVSDYLMQTGKAVILINEYDEYEVIYFAPDSRVEKKIVSAEDYVPQYDRSSTKKYSASKTIKFGSTELKIADTVKLYVNGTLFEEGAEITDDMLDKFLANAQGEISLAKTNDEVNKYDSIFVTHYEIGRVTYVAEKSGKTTLRVAPIDDTAVEAHTIKSIEMVIDEEAVEEGDITITVKKNGADVALKELVKDDIVAIATDVTDAYGEDGADFSSNKFIDILATNETVKGMVVAENDEVGTYTIGDTDYKYVGFEGGELDITFTYELALDPFGRIAEGEAVGSTDKYAIVHRYSNERVTLILADGTRATYDTANAASVTIADAKDSETAIQNRVVKYRVKNDEVTLTNVTAPDSKESKYNERLNKLGAIDIVDGINFIDATLYTETEADATECKKFDPSEFVSQSEYTYYAFQLEGFYSFVIVTAAGKKLTEESRFAVLTSDIGTQFLNDEQVYGAKALYNGEEITLYWEDDTDLYEAGDAIFYTLDGDGFVNSAYPAIYELGTTDADALLTAFGTAAAADLEEEDWDFANIDSNKDILLVSGIVTDVESNSIFFGVPSDAGIIDYNVVDAAGGVYEFGIADGCAAYEYDSEYEGRESLKYKALPDASGIMSSGLVEVEGQEDKYDTTDENSAVTEAVALIVNDDVVCIYVIYK